MGKRGEYVFYVKTMWNATEELAEAAKVAGKESFSFFYVRI
jgi:hypothetical protein